MPFNKGDIVTYFGEQYRVKIDNKIVIVLRSTKDVFSNGLTIPYGKSYNEIKLYLPEILKKL